MKTCPKCRKISVDNALWCDCGYSWLKAKKEQESTNDKAKKEQKFTNDKVNKDYELETINHKKIIDDLRGKREKSNSLERQMEKKG